MAWHIYLRDRTAFIPTVAQTDAGFYLDVDPVEVVSAIDTEVLQRAVKQAIGRGNPKIPTPTRATFPKPVVLKYAKVKSWPAFQRSCLYWTIEEKNGLYHVIQGRKRSDRGWEDDPTRIETLPPGAGIDEVAQRVASSVQTGLKAHEEPRSK
ncbi:hypothetical protein [Bradyrhizobium sp. CCBAU 11434]|uniref:hypothetical protein n=1 Tax=Bradyrhizobium sp. CCBAU 11434 TaxID=1630885 RepID=UPI0023061E48|nr:hypothetical protein [Bradyrhizobium sp. CCBAU 11434]